MSSSPLALARTALRVIHPVWYIVPIILLVALAGSSSILSQVRQSERIEDRLTGIALLDALRLYAEATPPGSPTRPADLADLVEDPRRLPHQTWLDAASAAELGDPERWELLHDKDGRLRGARRREAVQVASLTRWFSSAPFKAGPELVYAVPPDAPAVAKDPLAPQVDGFRAESGPEPTGGAGVHVAVAGLPQPVLPGAPPPGTGLLAGRDPATGGPDARLVSGFVARQVLRLSAPDDPPTVRPRRLGPPPAMPPAWAEPSPTLYGASASAAPASSSSPAPKPPAAAYSGPAITLVPPATAEDFRYPGAPRADRTDRPGRAGLGSTIDILELRGSTLISNLGDGSVAARGADSADGDLQLPRAGAVYEDMQDAAADDGGCRSLTKDHVQCEVLQQSDPDLYHRCNQSMSDRIAACIAGAALPPLVTR